MCISCWFKMWQHWTFGLLQRNIAKKVTVTVMKRLELKENPIPILKNVSAKKHQCKWLNLEVYANNTAKWKEKNDNALKPALSLHWLSLSLLYTMININTKWLYKAIIAHIFLIHIQRTNFWKTLLHYK